MKIQKAEKITNKLETDEQYLFSEFDGILFTSTIKTTLKPFSDMLPFLEETSLFSIQTACKNLREVFGPAFNEKTVVSLKLIAF